IRIRGVLGTRFTQNRRLAGLSLFLSSKRYVTVVSAPPADPFAGAPTLIKDALQYSAERVGQRLHIRGTVTRQHGQAIYVQDESGGMALKAADLNIGVEPGDQVDVVGYAVPGTYSPILDEVEVRKDGRRTMVAPVAINAEQALSGDYDSRLV